MSIFERFVGLGGEKAIAPLRLFIALVQGLCLYGLFWAIPPNQWPANDPYIFVPACLISVFVPLLMIGGLGQLRPLTLVLWKLVAVLVLLGLGLHAADRGVASYDPGPFELWGFMAGGLFIAHTLILAGNAERRIIAGYASYFDFAWRHIIQVAFACVFTGAFWLLFLLANELFKLIHSTLIDELLDRAWFVIPASTMLWAFALHMTDLRSGIVKGLRTLGLTLLSWLLVMMAGLIVAFLLALPFTGLTPLWEQKSATTILLICAASLIILVNAAYQDGEEKVSMLLRIAGWAGALALIPLVGLAGYALGLRIRPYGLTPDRVNAAACILIAAAYAIGYTLSLRTPKIWLATLPRTNIAVSFLALALLLALFSPIADPARLSVGDQMARLEAGKVTAEKFDYDFLRYRGARYGTDALKRLMASTNSVIAQKANEAYKRSAAYEPPPPPTPAELAARITVYPKGKTLPESFLKQDWSKSDLRWSLSCLGDNERCDAFLVDLDGSGEAEIVMATASTRTIVVLGTSADGHWDSVGNFNLCPGTLEAMRAGQYKPIKPKYHDLEVAGRPVYIRRVDESCVSPPQ